MQTKALTLLQSQLRRVGEAAPSSPLPEDSLSEPVAQPLMLDYKKHLRALTSECPEDSRRNLLGC
jgi:hypothetical protein